MTQMHEPSPRTSRLTIAGGLAAAIIVGGAGFVIGRGTAPAPTPVELPVSTPLPKPSPAAAGITQMTLDRTGLLALVNSAADAAASGELTPKDVQAAAGRRFDIVLPFGCGGPAGPGWATGLGWQYDEKTETLRIRVNPTRWSGEDWQLPNNDAESASLDGFWISRPWSSSAHCPPVTPHVPAIGEPAPLPGQTLAIARAIDGATATPPRPYETVQRLGREDFDPARGFHLRIIGRTDPQSSNPAVRCVQTGGSDQRPLCLFMGEFAELRIENPVDGKILASWPMNDVRPRDN